MTYRTVVMASMLLVSQVTAQPGPQPLLPPVGGRAAQVIAPQFTIQPAKTIEVTLENARNADARCFLDLDTGKVFTFGESTPDDFNRNNRFMFDNGIDLKCDTAFPSDGFAAYELQLIPTKEPFDGFSDHALLLNMFTDRGPATSIRLETVGEALPQRYVFKTGSGAVGVLEVVEKTTAPNGLKVRFKVIPKPEPVLARGRGGGRRGGVALNPGGAVPAPVGRVPATAPARAARGGGTGPGRGGPAPVATPEELAIREAELRRSFGVMNDANLAQLQQGPAAGRGPSLTAEEAFRLTAAVNALATQAAPAGRGGRSAQPTTRSARGRRGGPEGAIQQVVTQEQQLIQTQQAAYEVLRAQLGEDHPSSVAAKRRLEIYRQLIATSDVQTQTESVLAELKARRLTLEQNRAAIEQQIRQTQLSIEAIEADQRQARQPATAPTTSLVR